MNYVRPMVARSVTCIVLARARRPSFLGLRCKTIEVPELQLMNADWSTWLISTTSEFQHPELSGIVLSLATPGVASKTAFCGCMKSTTRGWEQTWWC